MIYLDNSATTQPHEEVLKSFLAVNDQYYANPASIHAMGIEANELLNRAREQMAELLNTTDKEVIFTSGGTESNNSAIFGIARANTHKGKHIITTEIEHASVLESVKALEKEGYEVDYLKVDKTGIISLEELASLVRKDTSLVSIMHVNNEMGAIQPIKEAASIIHANSRAAFHVDAVQSFGKLPITFNGDQGPDMISISAHKIHGLKGTGILAMRKPMKMHPYLLGGKQELGLRSGTVAVPQIVAMSKAARLAVESQATQAKKYRQWQNELREALSMYKDDVLFLSTEQGAAHILSFSVKDLKGEVIINALQRRDVIVSTSSACSSKQTKTSHVVEALQIGDAFRKGVIRVSFGAKLTDEDMKEAIKVFVEVMKELKGEQTK